MNQNIYINKVFKNILGIMFLMLPVFMTVDAQNLRVTLVVNSRPSPYLAEWYRPQNGSVVITALGGTPIDKANIRFETEILNSNGDVIYKLPYLQSEVAQAGGIATTLPLSNILQLQNGNFSTPTLAGSFSNGGKLSAGQYSIRIRVWDGLENIARSEWTASKIFMIYRFQLPQLMQPADGKALEMHQANSVIIFRWTPLVPSIPQAAATYRIQIWQVLPGQTPMQSLRSMPPVEDRLVKGTTQFIWQPRLNIMVPDPVATNQFIWTVQTLDEKDMPVETEDPSVEGRSQPFIFSFVNKNPVADSLAATGKP